MGSAQVLRLHLCSRSVPSASECGGFKCQRLQHAINLAEAKPKRPASEFPPGDSDTKLVRIHIKVPHESSTKSEPLMLYLRHLTSLP